EADYILGEIRRIVADPRLRGRTIGVISLLGDSQALHIWQRLAELFPPDVLQRHAIACGDARTFQGRERDIMFLSMVSAPNNIGAPLSRDMFAQRFNVAASRARDRMVLVRSVDTDDLSEADRLRRGLIAHFARPFAQHTELAGDLRERCESPMERELFDWLTALGFRVTPQARVGAYRIDLLVEGAGDARLAVQCDGDRHQGPESWNADIRRQRALERTGWVFWRCFATALVLRRPAVLDELAAMLESLGIRPAGTGAAAPDIHVETRNVRVKGVHSAGVGGATPVGSR
ncbi:MAG: AAA domain-containing protein, partial [Betaproteobacteria bacterium]